MKKYLLTAAVLIFMITVNAQETEKKGTKAEEGLKGTHRITLAMGHAHLSQGILENGKRGWKVIPSWGIDYDYWLNNHWAIGLQNDLMIESFEIEDHDNKVIERSRPFSSVASVLYKPKKHLSFIAGMGGEFSKEENFALTRLGIEAGWEMKKNWEFGISFLYDIKWNAYDTWVISFSISKLLRKAQK